MSLPSASQPWRPKNARPTNQPNNNNPNTNHSESNNETSFRRVVSSSPAAVSSSSAPPAVVVQQPPPPSQKQGDNGLTPLPMTLVPVDHLLAAEHEVSKALRSAPDGRLPLKNIEPLNGFSDLHMKMEVINAMIASKLITLDVKTGIVSLIKGSTATTLPPPPNPNDLEAACGCVLSILKNGEVFQSGTLGSWLNASGFEKDIREIAINKLLSAGLIKLRDEFPFATYSKVSQQQQQQVKSKAGKSNDDDDQQQLPPKKSHVASSSSPAATIPDPEQKQQISVTDNEAAGSESKTAGIEKMVSLLSSAVQQQSVTQTKKSGSFDEMSDDEAEEEPKYTEKEFQLKLGEAQLKMTEQYNARADELANHYKAEVHRLKSVYDRDLVKKLLDELANEKATNASQRAELFNVKAANAQFALQQQAWQKQVEDAKKQAEDLNKKIEELAIAQQQQIATVSSPAASASASASVTSTSPATYLFGEMPALMHRAAKLFDQYKLFEENKRDFSKSTFRFNPCLQGGKAEVLSKFLLPATCASFFKDPATKLELDTNKFELQFHGTPKQNLASILCTGFDASKRKRDLHGFGEYFGRCAQFGFCEATKYGDGMLVVLVMKNRDTTVYKECNHRDSLNPISVVNNCICHAISTFCLPIGYATDDDSVPAQCASCIPVAFSSSSGSFTALQFQGDQGNWVPWNPAEAQPVLAAINSGRTATPLTGVKAAGGKFSYTIDFANMVQINEGTNKKRVIRWI